MKNDSKTIHLNLSFGPVWEIIEFGLPIAAAHSRADAEDFAAGRISSDALHSRNEAIEAKEKFGTNVPKS